MKTQTRKNKDKNSTWAWFIAKTLPEGLSVAYHACADSPQRAWTEMLIAAGREEVDWLRKQGYRAQRLKISKETRR